MVNTDKQAKQITELNLRECYKWDGIVAGNHHFTDYWARDGYFAALGALEIGDVGIVKKMVELFFDNQRDDGLIPYRIMRGPVSLKKYFGKPDYFDRPKPTYKLRGFGNEVLDGTTLTLLLVALLGLNKLDVKKYLPNINNALDYLSSREKHGLLWDGVMAEWNDTALKFGNLLYTNIIYWYMYDRLATWYQKMGLSEFEKLRVKEKEIAKSLRKRLWNGKCFADWNDYKRQDYFYSFGNCLAIAWGLTTKKESRSILNECKKVKIGFTLETNSPKYPWWRIDPLQQLIGMGNYQNKSTLWWQPVTSYLAALKKMNALAEAKKVEKIINKKINEDKQVYECFARNGKPLSKLIYKSEHPFAWAAGMIVWSTSYK